MLILVRVQDGWALDFVRTSEASRIQSLFGSTRIPLPLTSRVEWFDAVDFAATTPAGAEHGVSYTTTGGVQHVRERGVKV